MHTPLRSTALRRCTLALSLALLFSFVWNVLPPVEAAQQPPEPATQAPTATYQVYLPFVRGSGKAPNNPGNPGGPTSEALIGDAYANGTLNADTALLYRVFAAFGDSRLPAQYRGDDSATPTSSAVEDATRMFAKLSPATQEALRPFVLPPDAPGSWEELRDAATNSANVATLAATTPRWAITCQTSTNIKVWYHPSFDNDATTARSICEEVDGVIWPKLTTLMGRGPKTDKDVSNNGGDGRFDIYLVDAMSTVSSPLIKCDDSPTYMLVNRNSHNRSQLAELLMRAILIGYDQSDCGEYVWMYRATTTWAMNYVYPGDDIEHPYAPAYLEHTDRPLDDFGRTDDDLIVPLDGSNPASFADGVYLWPFFMERSLVQPELIPAVWNRSNEPDSLAVTNSVLPGGFEQQWPDFSVLNWNKEPVEDYTFFDGIAPGTKPVMDEAVTLDGLSAQAITLKGDVKYLSSNVHRFTFTDPNVRSVALTNRYRPEDLETAHIDALIKIEGQDWKQEDWTADQTHPFCRDLRAERVEELVIVISNHEWQNRNHTLKAEDSPLLSFTNLACRGWQVEVKKTYERGNEYNHVSETVTANAVFKRYRENEFRWHQEDYTVESGTLNWKHVGNRGLCVGSGEGSYDLADVTRDDDNSTNLRIDQYGLSYGMSTGEWTFSGDRHYSGIAGNAKHIFTMITYTCPNQTYEEGLAHGLWLQTNNQEQQPVASDDGKTITGTYKEFSTGEANFTTTIEYTWTMTALPPE